MKNNPLNKILSRFILCLNFLFPLFADSALAEGYSVRLNCMNNSIIHTTLKQKNMNEAVDKCSDELKAKLKEIDTQLVEDDAIEVILSMIVSHNAARYGASSAIDYNQIRTEKTLNCSNQPILMGYLLPGKSIQIVGFDGGAVGNHSQALYTRGNFSLLLDPTASVIATIKYDSLLQGKPADNVILLHQNLENSDEITDTFTYKVISALSEGTYLPSDILYYYESLEHRIGNGATDPFITPGGVRWRKKANGGFVLKPDQLADIVDIE